MFLKFEYIVKAIADNLGYFGLLGHPYRCATNKSA